MVDDIERLSKGEKKDDYRFYFGLISDELKPNISVTDSEATVKIKLAKYNNAMREFNTKFKKGIDPEKAYIDTRNAYQNFSELDVLKTIPNPDPKYKKAQDIFRDKDSGKITAQEANEQLRRLTAKQRRDALLSNKK